MKHEGLSAKEVRERATREPDAVLRVWRRDGRKWVQKIAEAELAARAA